MKEIGFVILILLILFEVNYLITKESPCSAWSSHPQDCSSGPD